MYEPNFTPIDSFLGSIYLETIFVLIDSVSEKKIKSIFSPDFAEH